MLEPTPTTRQDIRRINKELDEGTARYFCSNPLNGREHEVSRVRSHKGNLQASLCNVRGWRTVIGGLRRAA